MINEIMPLDKFEEKIIYYQVSVVFVCFCCLLLSAVCPLDLVGCPAAYHAKLSRFATDDSRLCLRRCLFPLIVHPDARIGCSLANSTGPRPRDRQQAARLGDRLAAH
jgi:hypothetical protein